MKCQNCQEEMILVGKMATGTQMSWCKNCGTLLLNDQAIFPIERNWTYPKSINKIKELVSELIKLRDKEDLHIQIFNKRDKETADIVDYWDEQDRR